MSKAKDRLDSIERQARLACLAGHASLPLLQECQQLRDDVLLCAQEMATPESESEILEASGDFFEIAHLLDRLIRHLTQADFTDLEDCLQCLQARMQSAECHADSGNERVE